MRDDGMAGGPTHLTDDSALQAKHLVALAREARLLEFALKGDGEEAQALAREIESAIERAMEAEAPAEVTAACVEIEAALKRVVRSGMRLSAEMSDMAVEGVLGTTRMPVLTTVLTSATA